MKIKNSLRVLLILPIFTIGTACVSLKKTGDYANVAKAAIVQGSSLNYEWTRILPGPPPANSPMAQRDMEIVKSFQNDLNSPRREQARNDNSYDGFVMYGPIIGDTFTMSQKPEILAVWAYAGRALTRNSSIAKEAFPRPRPFLESNDIKVCVEKHPDGSSYPSGHAAWGWLSAQILARIYPDKTSAILERGREFGQSRVVCGVHYPSDVEAGRILADAILLGLDQDKEFQRLLEIAKTNNK